MNNMQRCVQYWAPRLFNLCAIALCNLVVVAEAYKHRWKLSNYCNLSEMKTHMNSVWLWHDRAWKNTCVYLCACAVCTCTACLADSTDYGRPMKPFFIEIPNFWAWTDKLGRSILGNLGYFWPNYQHTFWYCESLAHVFHYSTIISTKN